MRFCPQQYIFHTSHETIIDYVKLFLLHALRVEYCHTLSQGTKVCIICTRLFKNHLIVSFGKIKIFLKNNLIVIKNKDFKQMKIICYQGTFFSIDDKIINYNIL